MSDIDILRKYLGNDLKLGEYAADKCCERFRRNPDILSEFCALMNGEEICKGIEIRGYTARDLIQYFPSVFLSSYSAYSFLIMLREDVNSAYDLIKKGFPKK